MQFMPISFILFVHIFSLLQEILLVIESIVPLSIKYLDKKRLKASNAFLNKF